MLVSTAKMMTDGGTDDVEDEETGYVAAPVQLQAQKQTPASPTIVRTGVGVAVAMVTPGNRLALLVVVLVALVVVLAAVVVVLIVPRSKGSQRTRATLQLPTGLAGAPPIPRLTGQAAKTGPLSHPNRRVSR